jgi:hypothetical protein
MNNKHPCKQPVTIYTPQALHPAAPRRIAKLAANTKLPGVCMHIIGILRLMTCCSRHVVQSCGMYCTQAKIAAQTPRSVAQEPRRFGYQSRNMTESRTTMKKWKALIVTTVRASRQLGGGGELAAWSSGPGVGKKIRKRNMLL